MSLLAATTYLKVLREARGLTQDETAQAIGVSMRQLGGWERGDSDPASSSLAAFVRVVHGSAEQVVSLLVDPTATPADGARLAQEWVTRSEQAFLHALDTTPADADLHELLDLLRAFRSDPRRLGQLLGYAERLREEGSARRITSLPATR